MENENQNQESDSNQPLNMQDKAEANVTLGPSTRISSPSYESAPNSNKHQPPSIVQWSQVPPPGALNQWQQLPYPQHSHIFAAPPYWPPQPPALGGPFLGANVPAFFPMFTDTGWQAHPTVPAGTSSTSQTLVPNNHFGYTFPGFPGPWDPSSYLGQMYQMQHPYLCNFPGAPGFSSTTPRMPGCLSSGEQSVQKGILKPCAKLSQKHQQLWEAQSTENAQLWSQINKLQAEVSDYKDRLTKLQAELSSLKQKKVEVPSNEGFRIIPVGTGQPKKRGRPPKRSRDSMDALLQSHPQPQGREPAWPKLHFDTASPFFEKVILKKVETKEIVNHSTTKMAPQGITEKIVNAATNASENIQINQSNPIMSAYQGQVHQGIQKCGSEPALNSSSGVEVNFEKNRNLKLAYSKQPQADKVLNNNVDVSAKHIGNTGNGNLVWNSVIPSQDSVRDVLDVAHQSFFQNGSFIPKGNNITPEWNIANEEDASAEMENAIGGSTKDEDEEEMGDNISSDAEEIGVTE